MSNRTSSDNVGVFTVGGFFEALEPHFNELRQRLVIVVGSMILAILASSIFVKPLLEYLIVPCDCELILLKPTDGIIMYFRVALMMAGIITIPILTYHLLMFLVPAVETETEKKIVRNVIYKALPVTTLFFLSGVAFAWFVLVPTAIPFLRNFLGSVFRAEWTAREYISFITSLLFWMGVSFEMPVVFFVLARLGIIGPGLLIRNWRLAVVLITIAAALITPTVDPFNMILVVLPLLVLYAVSILLTSIAYKQRSDSTLETT